MWVKTYSNGKSNLIDCCDICSRDQTIIHLLFDCRYVHKLWEIISVALGWNVQQHNILYGSIEENFMHDNIVITVICFLIYKEWLLYSLDNKNRPGVLNHQTLKCELEIRKSIYEKCRLNRNVEMLDKILNYL